MAQSCGVRPLSVYLWIMKWKVERTIDALKFLGCRPRIRSIAASAADTTVFSRPFDDVTRDGTNVVGTVKFSECLPSP